MKHVVVAICAIFALTIANSVLAEDQHKGHEHGITQSATPATYKCPMHPEVTLDKPGKCPKCGMTMAKSEMHMTYRCPMHKDVQSDKPGKCPKCNMTLEALEERGVGSGSK